MKPKLILIAGMLWFCIAAVGQDIPITWDESALASMQAPLRDPSRKPEHMSYATYNRIPVLVVYKTYLVYVPGWELADYMDRLSQVCGEIPAGGKTFRIDPTSKAFHS